MQELPPFVTQRKWESKGVQNLQGTNPRGFKIYKDQIQGGFEALKSEMIGISEGEHFEVKFRGVFNFKKSSLRGGGGGGDTDKNGMTQEIPTLSTIFY